MARTGMVKMDKRCADHPHGALIALARALFGQNREWGLFATQKRPRLEMLAGCRTGSDLWTGMTASSAQFSPKIWNEVRTIP